jgi:Acetyltransferase (GNAT) family
MAGYFGTETQQRLQGLAEASAGFIRATRGACQTGRILGCDDPDLFGWDRIDEVLDRDGVCGFRMIGAAKAENLRSRLLERNYRLDTWDVFLAGKAEALPACQLIVQAGLPEGLSELEPPSDPECEQTARVQSLMAACGIAPFSGSMLTGECGPAATAVIGDGSRNPVAAAHAYLPHNAFSQYHTYAWGGLVSVAEPQRGKGLGSFINARLIVTAFERLGASHVYELVSAANLPSRRMAEACGLRHEAGLVCGIAVREGEGRFTR